MSEQDSPKYVIDNLFDDSLYEYDDVIGPGGPENSTPRERIWPAIPLEYQPPVPEIENIVAEVTYILRCLQNTLTPHPLPDDNLELMSDYLLSLETRNDITTHVLQHTDARKQILPLSNILLRDDTKYEFKSRAIALHKHWNEFVSSISKKTAAEILTDRPVPALQTSLPPSKPANWNLDLGPTCLAAAKRHLFLLNSEKAHCIRYWTTVEPPTPIGWAPIDDDAWEKVSRRNVQMGNLYFSKAFRPLWEEYGLARMDAMFWDDAGQEEERLRVMSEEDEGVRVGEEMRRVREEYVKELGLG